MCVSLDVAYRDMREKLVHGLGLVQNRQQQAQESISHLEDLMEATFENYESTTSCLNALVTKCTDRLAEIRRQYHEKVRQATKKKRVTTRLQLTVLFH